MKKNGFTLVELLGVIMLLGLLAIVIMPPMIKRVQNLRKDLSNSQISLVYSATETYLKKYKNDYPTIEGKKYCITLEMLVDEGLLDEKLVNHLNDSDIDLDSTVDVTVDSKLSYSYQWDPDRVTCSS